MLPQPFSRPAYTPPRIAIETRQYFEPVSVVRLLLFDRDDERRHQLASGLRGHHHDVATVASLAEVLFWLREHPTDLIVVAPELPAELATIREIRSATDLPVIVVSDVSDSAARIEVFDCGADDYLSRPLDPAELDRRARVLVRREQLRRRTDELTGPADLVMHVRAHEVLVGEDRLSLTPKEFAVLQLLLEHRGEVVSPDQISLAIWGYETFGSRNYVEAHVSRLRGKLAQAGAPDAINTVRGVGYVVR
jgi:DNA-binding response OmpR family regulator